MTFGEPFPDGQLKPRQAQWRTTRWSLAGGMLPFVLFAAFNVAMGNLEPLIGGPLENLLVMLGMGGFYAIFVLGPYVLLGWRAPVHWPWPVDVVLGALASSLMLLCVELLPLNSWGVVPLGAVLVVTGAFCATVVHNVRRWRWTRQLALQRVSPDDDGLAEAGRRQG